MKAILFDLDGVLIRLGHFFSKELELQGYENADRILNGYYCGGKHLASIEGKEDCKEHIFPYLRRFGWEYSAEEYLKQQFVFEHKYLDVEMINLIDELKLQGVKCCLATDQEQHRAQYLLESMNFKSIFDDHFVSCFIGNRKCQEGFWEHVVNQLRNASVGIEPEEIVFVDDIEKNIDMASKFGLKGILFETKSKFKKALNLFGLGGMTIRRKE